MPNEEQLNRWSEEDANKRYEEYIKKQLENLVGSLETLHQMYLKEMRTNFFYIAFLKDGEVVDFYVGRN